VKRIWIALPVLALVVAASALTVTLNSTRAVQAPEISLDMDQTGNTYDDATNSMAIGTIENCLSSATADPATHTHPTHLLIRNVEDLIAFQIRLNYIGDQMRPSVFNPTPFTDNTTGQQVGFINLPIDQASSVHRGVTPAVSIPVGAPGPQTALVGAAYNETQTLPVSPDTPAKGTPDDTSYSAPAGGVLGTLILQVVGDQSGQASLFMDLDDAAPNPPGTRAVIWTGTASQDIDLAESALFDGFHAEGATCQVVDVRNETFRNLTAQAANDLHVQFSGAFTPSLVSNAPGCSADPTFSGDHAAGALDVTWTEPCVDVGEEFVVEITSTGGVQRICSDWTLDGTAIGAPDGDTACTVVDTPTPTPGPGGPGPGGTPTRTPTPGPGAGGRTPTPRASPAALPPTGTGEGGWFDLSYGLLFISLAIPASGAAYGVLRLRRN
jgi:hypothetical protein